MTKRNTFKTVAIALAAIGTAITPAAFAQTADDVSVTIDARDLETDWGVEKIYDTLSGKAETACYSRAARKYSHDCMSDLLDDFIENVGHEKLTSYHAVMKN